MPLILVVEKEKRYVERIEQALSPQGWEILGVEDRAAAMARAAEADVAVLVVNAEVAEASELVASFGRSNGGPGAVVLVPENSDDGGSGLGADEVLQKPFTDQDISLAVRRCTSAAQPESTEESAVDEVMLTSEDIFGDVVLELESAFSLATGEGAGEDEQVASAAAPAGEPTEVEAAADEEEIAEEDDEAEVEAEEPESKEPAAVDEEEDTELAVADEVLEEEETEEVEAEETLEEGVSEEIAEEEEREEVEEDLAEAAEETPEEVGEVAAETVEPDEPVDAGDGDEVATATDSLLDQALGSLRSQEVKIDDEFTRPAEVTDAEIDAMVRSVVVGPSEPAKQPAPEPVAAVVEAVDGAEGAPEFDGEASGDDEDWADAPVTGRRPIGKLIVAIILAMVIALVLFMVSRGGDGDVESPVEVPAVLESGDASSPEPMVDEAAGAETGDGAVDSENNGDGE